MKNEKNSKAQRFDETALRQRGFVEITPGHWARPPIDFVDRLETREHAKQEGALDREAQTSCSGKTRSAKGNRKRKAPSNRRKRPHKLVVTLTAYLPRYLDSDNLVGALKPVRDEIAEWMGVDDADHRILWECEQALTRGQTGVCVVVHRP